MKRKCLFVFVLMFLFGCVGMQNLAPVDKASHVGLQLGEYYQTLYRQAVIVNENGSDEQKEFMRLYVNPKMDKTKMVLIKYDMLVLQWKRTGEKPVNLLQCENELRGLLGEVAGLIYSLL